MTGTAIDPVLGVCAAERHRVTSTLSPVVARLDEIIALLCHLNPRARIRLEHKGWIESIVATAHPRRVGHRPGWVQILDGRLSASKGRHVDTVR